MPLQEKLGLGIAGLQLGDTAKKIKKLSAQIIVDNSLPESMVKVIKEVSSGVLGMDAERGDILSAAGLAAFFMFVMKTFPGSADAVSQAVRDSVEKNAAGPGGGGFSSALTAASALSPDFRGRGISSEEKGHFSFLTPDIADKLIFLLKKEKPENIALVLNYAPGLSGAILSGLDRKLSGDALTRLTDTRSLPGEEVSRWENELRQKLDFFVGGGDIFPPVAVLLAACSAALKLYDTNFPVYSRLMGSFLLPGLSFLLIASGL